MTKLKPCPFCGGKSEVSMDITGKYVIRCSKCFLAVADSLAPARMTEEALVSFYNMRNNNGN